MRKLLFALALVLAACGGNGDGVQVAPEPVQHAPEISNLQLTPDSALYKEGGGTVQVTAEFAYTDLGRDIATLRIEISDGRSLTIALAGQVSGESGTLTETFDVTTTEDVTYTIEFWLVDMASHSSNRLSANFNIVRHPPEISSLTLSPATAMYMDGDGSVDVTVEITFTDIGGDIETLWIRLPSGAITEFDQAVATVTGTFTEDFTMYTETVGAFTVEFWLVDKAGDRSADRSADFDVAWNAQGSDWTSRLSGLPYVLNDVIWDGTAFIAVGNDGVVLTSADGLDWVERATPTDANLYSAAFHGSDIIAVGEGTTVLLSIDNGASWIEKLSSDFAHRVLDAVVINESRIVTGGFDGGLAADLILISEDGGETWTSPLPFGGGSGYWFADLVYENGLYVAATHNIYTANNCAGRPIGNAVARVSTDGEVWNEILLRNEPATAYAILHDGSRFVAVGSDSTVFTSADGYNWTAFRTPVQDVDYLSVAWDGSKLLAAGRISVCHWMYGNTPAFERPIGISSTDSGATWEIFTIDGDYESRAMAYGAGRFVSVGQTTPVSGEGAIYTSP